VPAARPGLATGAGLRIVERAGCDPHPLDPTSGEGRLRLSASVWGDQVDRFARQQGALAVAGRGHVPVEAAGAADWLARRLPEEDLPDSPATVVWHSVVRQYVDRLPQAHRCPPAQCGTARRTAAGLRPRITPPGLVGQVVGLCAGVGSRVDG